MIRLLLIGPTAAVPGIDIRRLEATFSAPLGRKISLLLASLLL